MILYPYIDGWLGEDGIRVTVTNFGYWGSSLQSVQPSGLGSTATKGSFLRASMQELSERKNLKKDKLSLSPE